MAVRIFFIARGQGRSDDGNLILETIRLEAGTRTEAYDILFRRIAHDQTALRLVWGITAESVTSASGMLPESGFDEV